MKRGATERETCDLNGWGVGTILRGHESWADGNGTWTTIRITAIGDSAILGRCVGHEPTGLNAKPFRGWCEREQLWTLRYRDWHSAPQPDVGGESAEPETEDPSVASWGALCGAVGPAGGPVAPEATDDPPGPQNSDRGRP